MQLPCASQQGTTGWELHHPYTPSTIQQNYNRNRCNKRTGPSKLLLPPVPECCSLAASLSLSLSLLPISTATSYIPAGAPKANLLASSPADNQLPLRLEYSPGASLSSSQGWVFFLIQPPSISLFLAMLGGTCKAGLLYVG